MHRSIITIIAAILLAPSLLFAFDTRQHIAEKPARAAGHYYAYPDDEISPDYGTSPEGYEAFYLSHYGRHGSRFLTSEEGYTNIMGILARADSAGVLTEAGRHRLRRSPRPRRRALASGTPSAPRHSHTHGHSLSRHHSRQRPNHRCLHHSDALRPLDVRLHRGT